MKEKACMSIDRDVYLRFRSMKLGTSTEGLETLMNLYSHIISIDPNERKAALSRIKIEQRFKKIPKGGKE